ADRRGVAAAHTTEPVGPVPAPCAHAGGGAGGFPARVPDAVLSHRRPQGRTLAGHPEGDVLPLTPREGILMSLKSVSLQAARQLLDAGAVLVDISGVEEYAQECTHGACHLPDDQLSAAGTDLAGSKAAIFHCRDG